MCLSDTTAVNCHVTVAFWNFLSICLSVCTVGPLCTYEEGPSSTREDCSITFDDYFATLKQVCEAGQPGVLKWTPDKNTPDTVYYQVCVCMNVSVCVCVCMCAYK